MTEQVTGYQKRAISDGSALELVALDLPETTFDTEAVWYLPEPAQLDELAEMPRLLGTLHAAEHAMIALLPLWAMCDRWDIGGLSTNIHFQTGRPTIFVYDGHPGGVGLTRRGYDAFEGWVEDTARMLAGCPCERGCPSCVQSPKCGNLNEPLDKAGALFLLERMLSSKMTIPLELRTERLLLRQWRDEDAEPLAAMYAQPEYLEHMPALDLEETRAQLERFRRQWREEGFSHWAVEDPASGLLIGRIGLLRHRDWTPGGTPVEVGWSLDRAAWGRGLATEGGRAALELWRERLPDDRELISITTPANVRSRAVMERLGLTLRGSTPWRGFDVVWYGIDR